MESTSDFFPQQLHFRCGGKEKVDRVVWTAPSSGSFVSGEFFFPFQAARERCLLFPEWIRPTRCPPFALFYWVISSLPRAGRIVVNLASGQDSVPAGFRACLAGKGALEVDGQRFSPRTGFSLASAHCPGGGRAGPSRRRGPAF